MTEVTTKVGIIAIIKTWLPYVSFGAFLGSIHLPWWPAALAITTFVFVIGKPASRAVTPTAPVQS